jgi:hypothetical protein
MRFGEAIFLLHNAAAQRAFFQISLKKSAAALKTVPPAK